MHSDAAAPEEKGDCLEAIRHFRATELQLGKGDCGKMDTGEINIPESLIHLPLLRARLEFGQATESQICS